MPDLKWKYTGRNEKNPVISLGRQLTRIPELGRLAQEKGELLIFSILSQGQFNRIYFY